MIDAYPNQSYPLWHLHWNLVPYHWLAMSLVMSSMTNVPHPQLNQPAIPYAMQFARHFAFLPPGSLCAQPYNINRAYARHARQLLTIWPSSRNASVLQCIRGYRHQTQVLRYMVTILGCLVMYCQRRSRSKSCSKHRPAFARLTPRQSPALRIIHAISVRL